MAETLAEQIRHALSDLQALQLDIEDQSAAHAGHAGAAAGAHLRLIVVSGLFAGCARVQRHRMVYDRLSAIMPGRIHALTMTLLAPGEAASRSTGAPVEN